MDYITINSIKVPIEGEKNGMHHPVSFPVQSINGFFTGSNVVLNNSKSASA